MVHLLEKFDIMLVPSAELIRAIEKWPRRSCNSSASSPLAAQAKSAGVAVSEAALLPLEAT